MNSDNKYMNDKHKEILERLWEKNSKSYQHQYPDMFDPKWTIMESGWPWLKLSSLSNQPFGELLKEAEA